ncbi:hypothetical protein GIB67_012951 [Kingdonia uniflora]|uniref:Growth-regulating factor n=1 Tax=Kingdonia uniflora TaxID=39325 RepID=A0A7J7NGA2_9MAGN|nr:hypothetical protein GIB67_012951 [Kingdonia uniflora]
MDYDLKQWRNQSQSDQLASAKIPKLFFEQQQPHHISEESAAALPLFVPEPNSRISNLPTFPDSTSSAASRLSRMGGLFSLSQWQELELQALIFKYMLAGIPVPAELLLPIKKSFYNTSACYLHYPYQQYQTYQPSMLQSGYWGRSGVDPEPGRCRRTDGKKWRCSRDVVAGQKYCERHVHRGRSRSRKPVEIPTPTASNSSLKTANAVSAFPLTSVGSGAQFSLSGSSPSIDLLQLNQRSSDSMPQSRGIIDTQNNNLSNDGRSEGQLLRHFFDDWPRSNQESGVLGNNVSPSASTTCLSISIPENPSSDFSLKLSTGNEDEPESRERNINMEQPLLHWGGGWGTNQVSSMGGPLAEALRSSTTNSPTSVLHELRRGSMSETSSFST